MFFSREEHCVIFEEARKIAFLLRTPKGQKQVSALQRCPYYGGRAFLAFLGPNELSVIERCPQGEV